jgi:conjugal transfer pilus assembly protein TraA
MTKLNAFMSQKKARLLLIVLAVSLGALAPDVMAGTGGTEFDNIYTLLSGWTQGTLGKIIALAMFLVGLSAGIINQSISAVVVGIGGALALFYGPTIITGVVTAVV